ncbi:acyl-CoA thioesterase [Bacillus salinus]|uniref:acyl-CoA thioesterase n=1 Tax=Bacillus sp. HMF5848 TaxID=2495421 RepID=UPI0021ADBFC6|nr:thioesterase family protein [Bacillus sp. HMF5848]
MKHVSNVTVRFNETDALGHVNNTSYFIYLEEARIRFFEELGYGMSTDGWEFILASTKCDFLNQSYFNQKLSVTTTVTRIGQKSFKLAHDILDSNTNQLIASGEAIIVFFDFNAQKSERLPDALRYKLEEYLQREVLES